MVYTQLINCKGLQYPLGANRVCGRSQSFIFPSNKNIEGEINFKFVGLPYVLIQIT